MNFKSISFLFFLLIGLLTFTSCEKENIDNLVNEEDDTTSEVVVCNFSGSISQSAEGTLMVNISGGTEPFNYEWSTDETTSSITVNTDGTYSVTVTDSEGCTFLAEITISIDDPCMSFAIEVVEDPVGTLTVSATGGTAPYTYQWSTGETTSSITVNAPGDYTVEVIESNGCTISQVVTASGGGNNPCAGLELEVVEDPIGTLTASATGGTAPYVYNWSTGETTSSISVIPGETYTVIATDNNGCTFTRVVVASGNDPCQSLELTLSSLTGVLISTVNGGTAPYTYLWSTGEMTSSILVSTGGDYSLTVTDANGCVVFQTITVSGGDPCLSEIEVVESPAGTMTATPIGGTAPYVYEWSTGEMTTSISVISGETYTVTVTDAIGCFVFQEVTASGSDPCMNFFASIEEEPAGTLTANVSGGTAPYVYQWSTGETTSSINVNAPGTYSVTAIDAMGCTYYTEFEL